MNELREKIRERLIDASLIMDCNWDVILDIIEDEVENYIMDRDWNDMVEYSETEQW